MRARRRSPPPRPYRPARARRRSANSCRAPARPGRSEHSASDSPVVGTAGLNLPPERGPDFLRDTVRVLGLRRVNLDLADADIVRRPGARRIGPEPGSPPDPGERHSPPAMPRPPAALAGLVQREIDLGLPCGRVARMEPCTARKFVPKAGA